MINVVPAKCHQREKEDLAVDAAKVSLAAVDLPQLAPFLHDHVYGSEHIVAHDARHDALHHAAGRKAIMLQSTLARTRYIVHDGEDCKI